MNSEELKRALQEPLFDMGVVRHGFTPYMRDYDIVAKINERQYLYRFTHCTSVTCRTTLRDSVWQASWDDSLIGASDGKNTDAPDGFIWGVAYARAYPGATLLENSPLAIEWSRRLGKRMLHVRLETNVYILELVFHDLWVREINPNDMEWVPGSKSALNIARIVEPR